MKKPTLTAIPTAKQRNNIVSIINKQKMKNEAQLKQLLVRQDHVGDGKVSIKKLKIPKMIHGPERNGLTIKTLLTEDATPVKSMEDAIISQ